MRYCFALDLIDDEQLMKEYEMHHQNVWPEIIGSIKDAGINELQIYRVTNRLFMIMETNTDFSFDKKARADLNNPVVQQWEALMWKYQQALPAAKPGEKWMLLNKIFEL
ncbi:MAG: L-rhamnose mutarotase [Chitinophagaceae bacterium]|nr:L-rhamnose mutarotase [Chitinophagaceae bacterium]